MQERIRATAYNYWGLEYDALFQVYTEPTVLGYGLLLLSCVCFLFLSRLRLIVTILCVLSFLIPVMNALITYCVAPSADHHSFRSMWLQASRKVLPLHRQIHPSSQISFQALVTAQSQLGTRQMKARCPPEPSAQSHLGTRQVKSHCPRGRNGMRFPSIVRCL
jgi:hypothetical protein